MPNSVAMLAGPKKASQGFLSTPLKPSSRKVGMSGAVRLRSVPELARMPDAFLHAPWEAPKEVREKAGVMLGENYPHPIVDHKTARDEALKAFKELKR